MARTKRNCPAGEVFHILNRAVARLTSFEKPEDDAAFMRVVAETWETVRLPVYPMVAMPNHWHWSSTHARHQPGDERLWLEIPDDPSLQRNCIWSAATESPRALIRSPESSTGRNVSAATSPRHQHSWKDTAHYFHGRSLQ